MYAQISTLVGQAVQLFQQGQLAGAETLLHRVLAAQPRNFDALHILGVIEAMQGRRDRAIELFRKALAQNKNHSFLQFNMAKALSESGRDEEALIHHKWATQLAPKHADAWLNYGLSLMQLNRLEEAKRAHDEALRLNPQLPLAWNNLALLLQKEGRYEEALSALDRAIAQQPELAAAHDNMGNLLSSQGNYEAALLSYEQALALAPGNASYWNDKGAALAEMNRHDRAIECYRKAVDLDSALVQAWTNMATSHQALAMTDQAIEDYRRALDTAPENLEIHTSLGQLYLQAGNFTKGWAHLDRRIQAGQDTVQNKVTRAPRWQGEASDTPLLLWGDQGIGDQILYASLLPELAELPQRKQVFLDQRLLPLFRRSVEGFEFLAFEDEGLAPDTAVQLPLCSLPTYLRPTLASFPPLGNRLLTADSSLVSALHRQVSRPGKLVCGVSWFSKREATGKHKSIPLEQLLMSLPRDRLHFVDLQYGDTVEERRQLEREHGIAVQHVDEVDNFQDIDGLAALIQACDIVITTSNSTAHLAGALGKQTLLLLPLGRGQLWYWVEHEGRNLWYPSVHAFAQSTIGNWIEPLRRLQNHFLGIDETSNQP